MRLVAMHSSSRAGTLLGGVVIVATGAGVHRCHKHKVGGVVHRVFSTRYGDMALLKGWRNTSRTLRPNSGISSRNKTPLFANDTSPGCGDWPPPISATCDVRWCGARKGRCDIRPRCVPILPATECIFVVSNASSRVIGGRMVGTRRASIVLPEPGEPIIITLWPPAAATSKARLTYSCPLTSAKSSENSHSASKAVAMQCSAGYRGYCH